MKYFEVAFNITTPQEHLQDARDLLAALAAEAGFETFEDTPEGIMGYVQQGLFDESALQQVIKDFPLNGTTIEYSLREAEDKDWNEQWEQEGFEPIAVGDRLLIHDGRHLGDVQLSHFQHAIEIDAHLAFGTGTHETTRMMVSTLLDLDLTDKRVLDCGCGTGILAIAAMKLGAAACTAYDIDEWSVDNTRHNAVINHVDITPLLGDATVLDNLAGQTFDVVLANINRNILLADMPRFREHTKRNSILIISGFYQEDKALLEARANELGLQLVSQKEDQQWTCLLLVCR